MNQITCQGKDCKTKGCRACGGYGYVLEKIDLECGHSGWFRPGNYTCFEGKRLLSLDGLDCEYVNMTMVCRDCALVRRVWDE